MRPAKLVKYLPDAGYLAQVIAAQPGGVSDPSLAPTFAPGVEVHRLIGSLGTRSRAALGKLKLGRVHKHLMRYALAGDEGFADLAETVARGIAIGRNCDVIMATSLPFSSVVAGAIIARTLNKPFFADLRDPWALAPRANPPTPMHAEAMKAIERWALGSASVVTMVTKSMQEYLPTNVADHAIAITNGFDPDDLDVPSEPRTNKRLRVVYTGSLYGNRTPAPLIEALEALEAVGAEVELVVAGSAFEYEPMLRAAKIPVDVRGYRPHREVIALMRSADAFIVLVGDQHADKHAAPGKMYEAIAAGPPVICWAPVDGEAAKIMAQTRGGRVVPNATGMADALRDLSQGKLTVESLDERAEAIAPFSRKAIAARFGELLDSLV